MRAESDVLIVGAGPAGAIAAWRLARAGARVRLVDRDRFPRSKLCGDTLNPGAVALLRSLALPGTPVDRATALAGMLVTGPYARVEARYGEGLSGRAVVRRVLDEWLVSQAVRSGACFEEEVTVRGALADTVSGQPAVRGVRLSTRNREAGVFDATARITIAADGRSSVVARSVGLVRFPASPRRWAFGTYATGIADVRDVGEMHVRSRRYVGIAPIAADRCNVCVVTGPRPQGRTPLEIIRHQIDADPILRERFAGARFDEPVAVLGPLALQADACGVRGLLLCGDAAGFVDPMTGDGIHLALRGGLMAAEAALEALETGDVAGAVGRLTWRRRAELGPKLRFNRFLRRLVETPAAVDAAAWASRLAPGAVRWAVRYAGDAA